MNTIDNSQSRQSVLDWSLAAAWICVSFGSIAACRDRSTRPTASGRLRSFNLLKFMLGERLLSGA